MCSKKLFSEGDFKMYDDIKSEFAEAKISITDGQGERLDRMTVFLQEYCKKVNLTAIRDREGIIEKHLVDSVLPLKLYEVKKNALCLDIGTGAGFPAIPMMIFRSDLKFTLLDARRKRTDYLTALTDSLGLSAEIIHGRAEELGKQAAYKNKYDMITARAVSDLPTLFGYAAPMLKKGGVFMAMRGSKEEQDGGTVAAAKKNKLVLTEEISYSLPGGDGRRLLIYAAE